MRGKSVANPGTRGRFRIIPQTLADDLIGLAALRNKTIHNNILVDDHLQLYGRLLVLICAGFASYEAFVLLLHPTDSSATFSRLVIDRSFVESLLRSRNTEKAKRALSRLGADPMAPSYVISRRDADGFLRLVRSVQATGD